MKRFSKRAASAAAVVGVAGLGGMAGGVVEKYTFTPIVTAAAEHGAPAPSAVNAHGMVAGGCQWTNAVGFAWTAANGASVLDPEGNCIFMSVRGLNDSGQTLFDGCVPPPGGNGPCGAYLARYTPGAGTLRIDNLPGAPVGATNWPVKMNASGAVALTNYNFDVGGSRLFVYSDAAGWQDLTSQIPGTGTPQRQVIDFNDAGQALVWTGGATPLYLYTPGVGTTVALPASASASDMNNAARITGHALFNGGTESSAFRAWAGRTVHDLDPGRRLPGSRGVRINDAGTVVGLHSQGFFVFSDAEGLVDLGVAGNVNGTPTLAMNITELNARGEFTGFELSQVYESTPVIKLIGQPLKRVQDEVDPLVQTIRVQEVIGLNDDGQFVVSGLVPGTNTPVSFLVTRRGCIADFDGSGAVSVQDLFAFLTGYFAGDAGADVDRSPGLSVGDVFAYLEAYFTGCTAR